MKEYGFHFDTTYTKLPEQFFSKLSIEPVESPNITIVNHALATALGLDFSDLSRKELAELFSGKHLPKDATPFSQAYAGHQFGHFTMLGDGRAVLLGEHITPAGERVDIQFKGSGRTPYSRRGDGKAALGPMLREYLISEAMYHLGIPTTRSLAVVMTGESIMRDTALPGAVLTRVASSHIRVGTFEFAAHQPDEKATAALMDYTIQRHYPGLLENQNRALAFISAVMEKQINLIVHWMRVGFIHGVMNTDNMALSGETLDYGPCAFMDEYDSHTVFSSIDHMGRYAYANQPGIAQWNLARLAETLLPLIDDDINKAVSLAENLINHFQTIYHDRWLNMMRAKLGLFGSLEGDEKLILDLLNLMQKNRADYTNTFRNLDQPNQPSEQCYTQKSFTEWDLRWQARREQNQVPLSASMNLMEKSNPAVIPRNHKVEQALEAANSGNIEPFKMLLAVLEEPYKEREQQKPYQKLPEPDERVYQTFCGT